MRPYGIAGTALLLMATITLSGCVSSPVTARFNNPAGPEGVDPILLSGELVFGEPVSPDELPDVDVLAIDPAMQQFVADHVGEHRLSVARLKRLLVALDDQGYFDGTYEALTTRSASDTFHTKGGNCLSYTSMFIALARASGIQAYYQLVNVPPTWNAASGMLIRNNHINANLRGARFDKGHAHEFTVDFNRLEPPDEFQRWVVSDRYATSLHYANVSVEALRNGQNREGFVYLRKALDLEPGNVDLWINLGAFYGRFQKYETAIEAFEVALQLDLNNRTAMSGLARGHLALGNTELAERYERRVRENRERNPYYHFAMAQSAFERAEYGESLVAVNQAIDLKRHNSRFHFMKALAELQLGDEEAARESFDKARRYRGSVEDLRERYAPELALRDG